MTRHPPAIEPRLRDRAAALTVDAYRRHLATVDLLRQHAATALAQHAPGVAAADRAAADGIETALVLQMRTAAPRLDGKESRRDLAHTR